jgi:hypothetical protein
MNHQLRNQLPWASRSHHPWGSFVGGGVLHLGVGCNTLIVNAVKTLHFEVVSGRAAGSDREREFKNILPRHAAKPSPPKGRGAARPSGPLLLWSGLREKTSCPNL